MYIIVGRAALKLDIKLVTVDEDNLTKEPATDFLLPDHTVNLASFDKLSAPRLMAQDNSLQLCWRQLEGFIV